MKKKECLFPVFDNVSKVKENYDALKLKRKNQKPKTKGLSGNKKVKLC